MGAVRKAKVAEERLDGAYLGVETSVRGLKWRERLEGPAVNTAIAISQRYGLPELLGRVLAARGVGLDDVPVVLDPSIKALMPDPSTLRDMDKGAARLEMDVYLDDGGMSRLLFEDNIEFWVSILANFEKHINGD